MTVAQVRSLSPFTYERRRPEESVLYNAISDNVNTVFANLEHEGKYLPSYVRAEFDKYLSCGILSHGFLRCRCSNCGQEKLVAFSCKCRGFCPSCGGRRMSERAMHLVDNVFPDQAIRQWVLSFPYNLRYLFAYHKKALHRALLVMIRVIDRYYIDKGKKRHGFKGRAGSVTLIQRFGGHINLNTHFHVLYLDGVYDDEGKFYRVGRLTDEEVGEVVLKIRRRVFRVLEKKGYIDGYDINYDEDELYQEYGGFSEILHASISNRLYLTKKGDCPDQIGKWGSCHWVELKGNRCAYRDGFSLHANVKIAAFDKKGRERLIRYVCRPAISVQRLKKSGNNKFRYTLKRPWNDGTEAVELSGEELVIRLISLVPPPRMNQIRYHGVLGPKSILRRKVVTRPKKSKNKRKKKKRYVAWAMLIKRVFEIDVTRCDCGGELKVVTAITEGPVIKSILDCIGLENEIPIPAPARAPPYEQQKFDYDF